MSPQVEASQEGAQDGVLLNHHRDSLRPLRLHILLPHLPLDHGRPRLLRKVGSSRDKNPGKNFLVLSQVLPLLEEEESAVDTETE